jgi:hypothetical protein
MGLMAATPSLQSAGGRLGVPTVDTSAPPTLSHNPSATIPDAYGRRPLDFEANRGQTDAQVRFLARGDGYTLFLTATEAVMVLPQTAPPTHGKVQQAVAGAEGESAPAATQASVLRMQLVGANPNPAIVGQQELSGKSNYFIGNDSSKWVRNAPHFGQVLYQDVYPGVDLVYYGSQQRQLEYDWVVAPGADPGAIRVAYQGTDGLRVDDQGNLVLVSSFGEVTQHAPHIYQEAGGVRQTVSGRYVLQGSQQVGLQLAGYDTTRPLIIDPTLSYSTYLGGSGQDQANAIAVDANGSIYITGRTNSTNFPPGMHSGFQSMLNGIVNAFVAKLNPDGSAPIYTTYLGGERTDVGNAIAVDAMGDAFVTGNTQSFNFPPKNPLFPMLRGGNDAFVTELNPNGSDLVYSTYLGGSGIDVGHGIAVDAAGNAYVAGETSSTDFPPGSVPGFQTSYGGGFRNVFVAELATNGTSLIYSTYMGSTQTDIAFGIALDAAGVIYITGSASSFGFRTTPGAFQTMRPGPISAFLSKINPTLQPSQQLAYSTFLGGNSVDQGKGVAVDSAGNAYVTGITSSTNFPMTSGAFQTTYGGGNNDAFVSKIDPTQSGADSLVYSTYLGGGDDDEGAAIAVDAAGDAYVTGFTSSTDPSPFPTTSDAIQPTLGSAFATNAFVSELNVLGSDLVYSSYFGGSNFDEATGIALDQSDNVYLAGVSSSNNLPPGSIPAFQPLLAGGSNAFVAQQNIPQFKVVNVIPNNQSNETDANSEPSIAVDPSDPTRILITAFGPPMGLGGQHPVFFSDTSGTTWSRNQQIERFDGTLDWTSNGNAYAARNGDVGVATQFMDVLTSRAPLPPVNFQPIAASRLGLPNVPDQPWIKAIANGADDSLYVGFNNGRNPPQTASVHLSVNSGGLWNPGRPGNAPVVIDRVDHGMRPGNDSDGPAVRVAPAPTGGRVYAAFEAYMGFHDGTGANRDRDARIIVVRDDLRGTGDFMVLPVGGDGSGVNVLGGANTAVVPNSINSMAGGTKLGVERLGSDLALAVDPINSLKVFVAYASVNGGVSQVNVASSVDGGDTWPVNRQFLIATNAALPSLAVAQNGVVGLLYTQLVDGNLETRFIQSADDFMTRTPVRLAKFPNNVPPDTQQGLYIGDFQQLVTIGNKFFGAFSASNDPISDNFPAVKDVLFNRSFTDGTGVNRANGSFLRGRGTLPAGVDVSIDPYFFSVQAVRP